MSKKLAIILFGFGIVMTLVTFPDGALAALLVAFFTVPIIFIINRTFQDKEFITQIFLIALILRLFLGLLIHFFDLYDFFAGDARTYDFLGYRLIEIFYGLAPTNDYVSQRAMNMGSGWGMPYLVASIYFFIGRNVLAAQSFCAVVSAATIPAMYSCAYQIYKNTNVSRKTAILTAVYPALVIWTGQLLKDGIIIFLLVFSLTLTLQIIRKLDYIKVLLIIIALAGIMSLRFYIFYIVSSGILGAFLINPLSSFSSIIRNVLIVIVIGLGLTYLGVLRNSGEELDKYANLERIQAGKIGLANSAESGYGEDLDVSTPEGVIFALPTGLVYLMLAPFPWQANNFRQLITLPETFLWWSFIPLIIYGFWYTLKNKLRESLAVLIFVLMLTFGYSIYQGNVGTAYRQRTQIQVFLLMFGAVGWSLIQERRENVKFLRQAKNRELRSKSQIRQIEI